MIQKVKVDGLAPTLKALKSMDKDFRAAAKDQGAKIADQEASRIRSAARTRLQRLAAQNITSRRGTTPGIVAGGSKRVSASGGRKVRAGDVFFGAEFGGGSRPTTQQFPPHKGKQGYFFWPTIRSDAELITEQWTEALDVLAEGWDH